MKAKFLLPAVLIFLCQPLVAATTSISRGHFAALLNEVTSSASSPSQKCNEVENQINAPSNLPANSSSSFCSNPHEFVCSQPRKPDFSAFGNIASSSFKSVVGSQAIKSGTSVSTLTDEQRQAYFNSLDRNTLRAAKLSPSDFDIMIQRAKADLLETFRRSSAGTSPDAASGIRRILEKTKILRYSDARKEFPELPKTTCGDCEIRIKAPGDFGSIRPMISVDGAQVIRIKAPSYPQAF